MTQNQQFEDAMSGLNYAKESLDPARFVALLLEAILCSQQNRLRNHDLLTSLDVLTTGSYLRLPTCIKVLQNLSDEALFSHCMLENGRPSAAIDGFRSSQNTLGHGRCHPVSFAHDRDDSSRDVSTSHRYISSVGCNTQLTNCLANGRVHFTAPKLFEVSLCLRGAHKDDGWFFVQVEFLINIGGGLTGLQGRLT